MTNRLAAPEELPILLVQSKDSWSTPKAARHKLVTMMATFFSFFNEQKNTTHITNSYATILTPSFLHYSLTITITYNRLQSL